MYFIPTVLIKRFGTKSKSIKSMELFKNNYEMLENCKNEEFIIQRCKDSGFKLYEV